MDPASHNRQIMRLFFITILLSTLVWGAETQFPKSKLEDLNGRSADLQPMMQNKYTLINFWATYCVPCRKEMKHLEELNAKYGKNQFQVIGVAIDNSRTVGRVKGLVHASKLTYTILIDTDQHLYRTFNTNAVPYSVLVNPQGEIIWEHTGYIPGDEQKLEQRLLDEFAKSTN